MMMTMMMEIFWKSSGDVENDIEWDERVWYEAEGMGQSSVDVENDIECDERVIA